MKPFGLRYRAWYRTRTLISPGRGSNGLPPKSVSASGNGMSTRIRLTKPPGRNDGLLAPHPGGEQQLSDEGRVEPGAKESHQGMEA